MTLRTIINLITVRAYHIFADRLDNAAGVQIGQVPWLMGSTTYD